MSAHSACAPSSAAQMSARRYTPAGRGSFLPDYIRTIGMPDSTNRTTVFKSRQTLTQRVRSEFIGRGRYKILPQEGGVDAVLRAKLTAVTMTPTRFNAASRPRATR